MAGWKSDVRRFGVVQSRSLVKAAGDLTPPEEPSPEKYRKKEQADVCLKCKKKNCSGTAKCFREQMKASQATGVKQ